MKKIIIILFLFLPIYGNAQADLLKKTIEACDCPNRLISTDSVYSFFQSEFFNKLTVSNYVLVLDKYPISQSEFIKRINKRYTLLTMMITLNTSGYNYFMPNRAALQKRFFEKPYIKTDYFSVETYIDLMSAALDTTTRYTEPIKTWDVSRLGREWMLSDNYQYIDSMMTRKTDNQIDAKRKESKRQSKKVKAFIKGIEYPCILFAYSSRFINMSLPVFDSTYNYAVIGLTLGNNNNTTVIFKREVAGWTLLMIESPNFLIFDFKYEFDFFFHRWHPSS
jgi:hypothetical protein